jgi:hypothetical protein
MDLWGQYRLGHLVGLLLRHFLGFQNFQLALLDLLQLKVFLNFLVPLLVLGHLVGQRLPDFLVALGHLENLAALGHLDFQNFLLVLYHLLHQNFLSDPSGHLTGLLVLADLSDLAFLYRVK